MARVVLGAVLVGLLCGFTRAAPDEVEAAYAEAHELGIADLFRGGSGMTPVQKRRAAAAVVREARAVGLDPLLVAGVISVESSFRSRIVSSAGAIGLMQVMPDTGAWFGARIGMRLENPEDLFDPERNIHIGVRYLAWLLRRFDRLDHALVAYNAGPARAEQVLRGPDADRWLAEYPRRVLRAQRQLRAEIARR
jgi:soluble lytic murein transglycosylase-like protein